MQGKTRTRADLYAVVFALAFPSLVTLVYFTLLADAPLLTQYVAYSTLKVAQFGFPLLWVLAIQKQRLQLYLPSSEGLVPGIAFGVVIMIATWALYQLVLLPAGLMEDAREPVQAKVVGFGVATLASYIVLAVFYSVVHSFLEEYYWRWFVFAQLSELTRLNPAIVISSLGFMAHHVIVVGTFFGFASPVGWLLAIAVAVGGAVWAWMYHRWGSLYPIWIGHFFVDAGIFWVGYDFVGLAPG
ncbi:MAG: CPBP family intramembrane glutamic endopeptidase [Gammaproteobacteria bacterium]